MTDADQAIGAKREQHARSDPVHERMRKLDRRDDGEQNDYRNGGDVAQRERYDSKQHGSGAPLLHAERHREQPSHPGIEPVITAEKKERGPSEMTADRI